MFCRRKHPIQNRPDHNDEKNVRRKRKPYMKRIVFVCSIVSFGMALGHGQFKKGNYELSLSASLRSSYYTSTYEGSSSSSAERRYYLILDATVGLYVWDGLSLEMEWGLSGMTDEPGHSQYVANISYTYPVDSKLAVFGKAGYGISDYIPVDGPWALNRVTLKAQVTNFATGIKLLFNPAVALKVELNNKKYEGTKEAGISLFGLPFSATYYSASNINLLVGFLILL